MAFHSEVGSGSSRASTTGFGGTAKTDFLTKLVQFACSRRVATVAVNSGGTGYVVGDVLTLGHASAHLPARFEVTSVSGGVITGLRINANGAYAQKAASAAVSAGGTGYAVGNILRVDGGSSRMPAKFQVATLSGSAVATVTLFEGGGAYSSTPSNPAATTKVGPLTGSGSGCTLTVTYQSIIGTTGLSVTGGSGSGATVDITLAENGWSVDGRNRNDFDDGDVSTDDEKQVTLVGDAAGFTNKPFVHFITGEIVNGLDIRHYIQVLGSTAHNPSLAISSQPGISPGYLTTGGAFMPFPQNNARDVDFWFRVTDRFIYVQYNENPNATTDNGRYLWGAAGFYDRLGTESEDPYPFFVGACSIIRNPDATLSSTNISSIAEQYWSSSGSFGTYYYDATSSSWRIIHNGDSGTNLVFDTVMFPFGQKRNQTTAANEPNQLVIQDNLMFEVGIIDRDRAASSRVLRRVPGTTPQFLLYPLVMVTQLANTPASPSDRVVGTIPGVFWLYNDNNTTGARIANFSEDYITIGSNRYRIFHNHVHTERYQYIALLEDV